MGWVLHHTESHSPEVTGACWEALPTSSPAAPVAPGEQGPWLGVTPGVIPEVQMSGGEGQL